MQVSQGRVPPPARQPQAGLLDELNGFSGSWFEAGGGFHGMMNYWFRTARWPG